MRTPQKRNLLFLLLLIPFIGMAQEKFYPPSKITYNLRDASVDTLQMDTITSGSHQYHPLYAQFPIWHDLGNIGFPALPAKWNGISELNTPHFIQGLLSYANPMYQLIYYDTKSPYALLNYTSGGSEDINGQYIKAIFSKALQPGLHLTAFLDFINSPGHYKNQAANQSSFTVNVAYHSKRYRIDAGLERLSFGLGENGGIQDPGQLLSTSPGSLGVNLGSGESKTDLTIIQGIQTWQLFGPPSKPEPDTLQQIIPVDSLGLQDSLILLDPNVIQDSLLVDSIRTNREYPKVFHRFNYQLSKRLYKDGQRLGSSTFYDNFYITESGAADSIAFSTFSNEFGVVHQGILWDSISWLGQAGLAHDLSFWTSNELRGSFQQFGLFALADVGWKSWVLNAETKIQFLGYNPGAYRFSAKLGRRPGSSPWRYFLLASSKLNQPSFFFQVYSGNHDRWFASRKNQLEQSLGIELTNKKIKLNSLANFTLISNLAYFDANGQPQQISGSSFVASLESQKSFKAGPFQSDNHLLLQYSPSQIIPLPNIVAGSSNYMHHDILFPKTNGKLELEYGLVIRYASPYQGYAYRPSTGAFIVQNQVQMGNYPYVDPFVTARVKRTRVFVRYEHVTAGLFGQNFMPVMNYPLKQRFLKYGVYWHFYD